MLEEGGRPDIWHRVAWVTDEEAFRVRKYVDGRLVGAGSVTDLDFEEGRLTVDSSSLLVSDDSDADLARTESGFVTSIQFRAEALSNEQMIAIGGPSAGGIPQEPPAVPSFIVEWFPRGDVAPLDTSLGAPTNETIILDLGNPAGAKNLVINFRMFDMGNDWW